MAIQDSREQGISKEITLLIQDASAWNVRIGGKLQTYYQELVYFKSKGEQIMFYEVNLNDKFFSIISITTCTMS